MLNNNKLNIIYHRENGTFYNYQLLLKIYNTVLCINYLITLIMNIKKFYRNIRKIVKNFIVKILS